MVPNRNAGDAGDAGHVSMLMHAYALVSREIMELPNRNQLASRFSFAVLILGYGYLVYLVTQPSPAH